jgi:hypothetical protein
VNQDQLVLIIGQQTCEIIFLRAQITQLQTELTALKTDPPIGSPNGNVHVKEI